ncbi:MAG: hypothetical protein ABSF81_03825 [Bacteroidales bacterium]
MNDNPKPFIFLLMPFSKQFDELEKKIRLATEKAGARAERVDKQRYKDEDVLQRINDQIDKAVMLVAVTTGNKPNVFYEIGLAHALRKHVVLLTNNTKTIPYDLKHFPSLEYKNVDNELVKKLTEELKWHLSNPTTGDKYYQEFKSAFANVESFADKLMPFFLPIASRYLLEWSEFIGSLITDGIEMSGPERLEITRLLTLETKKYSLIEQITGNPTEMHSLDWISFYNQIGKQGDIEKRWILSVEMDEVTKKRNDIAMAWRFFRERNFETLYCSPTEFRRATGEKLPGYNVIENMGEYIKLLMLPDSTYTSGEHPNMLHTTIRISSPLDRRTLESIIRCSTNIDEQLFKNIPMSIS